MRGVFYQLIKHCILMRRLIDIKSLHVMYYRPFGRSMGCNELLNDEFLKSLGITCDCLMNYFQLMEIF